MQQSNGMRRATYNMTSGVQLATWHVAQHTTWHVVGAVRGVRPEDPEDPHFDEAGRLTL
jgi:hypothetical protein